MPEPITRQQLVILTLVGKHPNVTREQLMQVAKATEADIKYLELHDMIREREVGQYRIAHFGELVLRRGLQG
jgi:hypothetical protein